MADPVRVSVELPSGQTVRVGDAHFSRRRAMTSTTFMYDPHYLRLSEGYDLDPTLPLTSTSSHIAGLPRAFADSAPDRWGRNLIRKRLGMTGDTQRSLSDVDFLLGVSDVTRQGALRFQSQPDGPFRSEHGEVPPLVYLPRLLRASEVVAAAGASELHAVKELLDAGSGSLGGARPKASVRDGDKLMIAKFPHPHDDWDVMCWEATTLDLAKAAGLTVPEHRLITIGGRGVLLLTRFDRTGDRRVGYLSAMSMTGARDGEARDYTELAEAMAEHSDTLEADLHQLLRRIVFSVAVRNTDDHLRNHGFLRIGRGWRLAPAFDLNPDPSPSAARTTGIPGAWDPADEIDGIRMASTWFRVDSSTIRRIATDVVNAVRSWRTAAARNGISQTEIARFAPSLDDSSARLARLID